MQETRRILSEKFDSAREKTSLSFDFECLPMKQPRLRGTQKNEVALQDSPMHTVVNKLVSATLLNRGR